MKMSYFLSLHTISKAYGVLTNDQSANDPPTTDPPTTDH